MKFTPSKKKARNWDLKKKKFRKYQAQHLQKICSPPGQVDEPFFWAPGWIQTHPYLIISHNHLYQPFYLSKSCAQLKYDHFVVAYLCHVVPPRFEASFIESRGLRCCDVSFSCDRPKRSRPWGRNTGSCQFSSWNQFIYVYFYLVCIQVSKWIKFYHTITQSVSCSSQVLPTGGRPHLGRGSAEW